jgi:hypothetical protein
MASPSGLRTRLRLRGEFEKLANEASNDDKSGRANTE